MNSNLPRSTICYFLRGPKGDEEIFLGEKVATPKAVRRRIAGRLMSYGGDVEQSDTSIKASLIRELGEESGFSVNEKDLEITAEILIRDENGPRLILYYLFTRTWTGSPTHFKDILDPRWFSTQPLPENILDADKLVLPILLGGKKIKGSLTYDENMRVVATDFKFVQSIE